MPRGTHHDLTGVLGWQRGILVLRQDDGAQWRLDSGVFLWFRARRLIGQHVRVVGFRSGFNALDVKRLEVVR
jgi:hypothetical protein